MNMIFLNYLLFLGCILVTVLVLDYLSSTFISLLKTVYDIRDLFKFRKLDEKTEEEEVNEIIDDSFTTQELAEVERFRARLDALRKDKDGLYDVHNVRFDNFTGVETSE